MRARSQAGFRFLGVVLVWLVLLLLHFPHRSFGQPFTNTVIALENKKTGSADWLITHPAQDHQIEGYASLTSVNRGGQLDLLVNTTNTSYILEVFRIGWYGGAGARRVFGPQVLPGTRQPLPVRDPTSGLIECQWTNAFILSIPNSAQDPTDWATGVYLAKLTGSEDGTQSYIIFAVRDDERPTDLLAQLSFTTYEAYNNWGGASLYDANSPGGRAAKVSFNRPFAMQLPNPTLYWRGAGEFFGAGLGAAWECNLVRWLEREGYEVAYCTSVDTHAATNLLWNREVFVSMGHDEYWSYPMRWNVAAARGRGVSLAFFASNVSFWQVRFEPSAVDGAPDRTVVCYKSTADPVFQTTSNRFTTVNFRDYPVLDCESSLLGVSYDVTGIVGDMLISDPGHWAFADVETPAGLRLPGILGYEVDSTNLYSPPGTWVACASPYLWRASYPAPGRYFSDAASYVAPSGATVFASGSMQWSWGLDDFNAPILRQSFINPVVQQATRNILARLLNQPAPAPTFFSRLDFVTTGDWKPRYGAEGFVLPNDATNLPTYAVLDTGSATVVTLLDGVADTNSLQRSSGPGRYLGGWLSSSNLIFDVNLGDGRSHQVALYFCDWENAGRIQAVELVDAVGGSLLDQRTVSGFSKGQWWVWQLKGHVQFRITNRSGPDCLVNAFMLGSGGACEYVGADDRTQGRWQSNYGSEGAYNSSDGLLAQSPRVPAYAAVQAREFGQTIWSWPTEDPRALTPDTAPHTVLGGWTIPNNVGTFALNFTDDSWHQVALYCVDADRLGRRQNLSVVDASNGAVLDTRELQSFEEGKYFVWNLRGAVKLRVECTGPVSAAVSGLFLDPPNHPPSVSITTPTNSAVIVGPSDILLAANAWDSDGEVRAVTFYTNGAALVTVTSAPFEYTWTNAQLGQYQIRATAMDNRLASATSAPVLINVMVPPGYQPPSVQLIAPQDGSSFQAPTNLFLGAAVSEGSFPLASLQFLVDGVPYGQPLAHGPYSLNSGLLNAGTHSVAARATDEIGNVVYSVSNQINILPAPAGALFHHLDISSRGDWIGLYGSQGFLMANAVTNIPAFATIDIRSGTSITWTVSTRDPRAPQLPDSDGRLASAWLSSADLVLDLNLLDGAPHRAALYCLDWERNGNGQTIEVRDAASGTVLDTRILTNFSHGVFLAWDIIGHVQFVLTSNDSNQLPALSALYFDPPATAPSVVMLSPDGSPSLGAPSKILLQALAIPGSAALDHVEFLTNGALFASTASGPPYSLIWTSPPPATYVLSARAMDILGAVAQSAPVPVVVLTNDSAALFAGFDTRTSGEWIDAYGRDGFVLAGDRTHLPTYATADIGGQFIDWEQTISTRALRSAFGGARTAAAWFSFTNLELRVSVSDSAFHRVALYCLDWYCAFDTQTVSVRDTLSGAELDRRQLPSFLNGTYAVWDVKGQVTFRITRENGSPALLSGIFFDPPGVLPPIAITSPTPGGMYLAPTNLLIQVEAPADSRVNFVEIYGDGSLLRSFPEGTPCSLIWSNPPVGTHSLVASEVGMLTTAYSPSVNITVLSTNSLAFLGASVLPDGSLAIDAFGPASQPVVLLGSESLDPAALWIPLMTNVPDLNRFQFLIADPAVYPQRFYRLVSP